ncbi:MAG: glycosyltransferase [Gammaproteobacteria bacterium]
MPAFLPRFSVIIATYNRSSQLCQCLEALASLDYPMERREVIVVDDGGCCPLDGIVEKFRDRMDIRLLRQDNAGPGAARNTGAARATGEYLAFTDDDCQPQNGWLRGFAAAFESRPDALLGGGTLNGLTDNIYAAASQTLQSWFYDYCKTNASPLSFFASNNLSISTALFQKMAGFDTKTLRHASEDRDLCGRWLAQGRELIYVPLALVRHKHELNMRSFWLQHFNYGRGAYRLRLARKKMGLTPLPPDRRWIFESVLRRPFSEHAPLRGILFAVLIFIAHLANTAGFMKERSRK